MVIARLIGGMGNQMFQYAAGLALSEARGAPLRMDASAFSDFYQLRPYRLDRLSIAAAIASPAEIRQARGSWDQRFASRAGLRLLRMLSPDHPRRWLREDRPDAPRRFLADPSVRYLDGYWQSEKWFEGVSGKLRRQFSFASPPSNDDNLKAADAIVGSAAICVHVRRGDYVSNAINAEKHGALSAEYYGRAVAHVLSRVVDGRIFVFSDDHEWARTLVFPAPSVVVSHNSSDRGDEDLRLMTLCRHHVIANSSLSWWGAWLAEGPQQQVVAPARWFSGSVPVHHPVVPERWTTM